MDAGRSERRPVKLRRRGRHTSPSQVEKVAAQAGKAAPAVAIAGALVAVPHAVHASTTAAQPVAAVSANTPVGQQSVPGNTAVSQRGVATTATLDSVTERSAAKALTASTHYTVQPGDTLSKIAGQYYGQSSDWQWLFHENDSTISDPNSIFPGQNLYVPADPPANYTLPSYTPKHAAASSPVVQQSAATSSTGNAASSSAASISYSAGTAASGSSTSASGSGSTALSGTLACSGLEELWENAGGNSADAEMAASIAMAESGGNQYAVSPTDDYGYWQINASNGSLATTDPYGNARAAIQLSDDGTSWDAWTTYTSGAYEGKC